VPAFAQGKGHKHHEDQDRDEQGREQAPAVPTVKSTVETRVTPGKEPWVGVNVTISENERHVIQGYVDTWHANQAPARRERGLPPGLARKRARGGELPPGWKERCVKGEIMPAPVYERCRPLPPEIVVKLPPPPVGTITVTIDGKVARLAKATLEILDVFDVRF
jgi:hypothetical protein